MKDIILKITSYFGTYFVGYFKGKKAANEKLEEDNQRVIDMLDD